MVGYGSASTSASIFNINFIIIKEDMVVMFLLTSGVFCFGADSCSMDGFSGEHCRVGARCGTIKVTAHWRARLTATFQTCSTKKNPLSYPFTRGYSLIYFQEAAEGLSRMR